ncbi:MAG: hypothetical protein WA101_01735 [Minisyncoccia bacterium]
MNRRILTRDVTVPGPNFFGTKSSITFVPVEEPGWFLLVGEGEKLQKIPIDHRIASYCSGRIKISFNSTEINIWEHIGALRFLGIDGIGVKVPVGSKWPPYLGGAAAYYKELVPYIKTIDEKIPEIKIRGCSSWRDLSKIERIVFIAETANGSMQNRSLILDVSAQWKPFPEDHIWLNVGEESRDFLINEVFQSKPQGYPLSRYYAAKTASFFGWPNMKYISWANDFKSPEEFAHQCCLHRVQDFLGGLSLASHFALPKGSAYSLNGGHKGDLRVVKVGFPIV